MQLSCKVIKIILEWVPRHNRTRCILKLSKKCFHKDPNVLLDKCPNRSSHVQNSSESSHIRVANPLQLTVVNVSGSSGHCNRCKSVLQIPLVQNPIVLVMWIQTWSDKTLMLLQSDLTSCLHIPWADDLQNLHSHVAIVSPCSTQHLWSSPMRCRSK